VRIYRIAIKDSESKRLYEEIVNDSKRGTAYTLQNVVEKAYAIVQKSNLSLRKAKTLDIARIPFEKTQRERNMSTVRS
jgi:hypothetical protein